MGREIREFADNVGARSIREGHKYAATFRQFFKRDNYFLLPGIGKFMLVKKSLLKKPFWGVGKKYINFLNQLDYFLVLLVSSSNGWVFSKEEVNSMINHNTWPIADDGEYKIHSPLPQRNLFNSPQEFKVLSSLVAPDKESI